MSEGLDRAKEIVGGSTALARKLAENGVVVTPQAISQWERVPAERVPDIERVTGVPRHELRPDLWDKPQTGAAA